MVCPIPSPPAQKVGTQTQAQELASHGQVHSLGRRAGTHLSPTITSSCAWHPKCASTSSLPPAGFLSLCRSTATPRACSKARASSPVHQIATKYKIHSMRHFKLQKSGAVTPRPYSRVHFIFCMQQELHAPLYFYATHYVSVWLSHSNISASGHVPHHLHASCLFAMHTARF